MNNVGSAYRRAASETTFNLQNERRRTDHCDPSYDAGSAQRTWNFMVYDVQASGRHLECRFIIMSANGFGAVHTPDSQDVEEVQISCDLSIGLRHFICAFFAGRTSLKVAWS